MGSYNDADDEDEDANNVKSTGSIFAWYKADQVGSVGILHVILALILVNGRAISDSAFMLFSPHRFSP